MLTQHPLEIGGCTVSPAWIQRFSPWIQRAINLRWSIENGKNPFPTEFHQLCAGKKDLFFLFLIFFPLFFPQRNGILTHVPMEDALNRFPIENLSYE